MGQIAKAKCLDCGKSFELKDGGGFSFHLVRCDKCGKTKSIGFDDIGELHLRYLKGLPGPNSVATSHHDDNIRKHARLQPISEQEYYRGVNAIAGNCCCGGKYSLDAPARCPRCHSTRIKANEVVVLYD